MKINHENLIDDGTVDNNPFKIETPLEKTKEKKPKHKSRFPKRKVNGDRYHIFYLLHLLWVPFFIGASILTGNYALAFLALPYLIYVGTLHQAGGGLEGKGMDYLLWNLSVLASTYSNAQTPHLRSRGQALRAVGGGLTVIGSLIHPWFLLVGGLILLNGLVVSFAERNGEQLARICRIISMSLFLTGTITLLWAPEAAVLTASASLLLHYLYERWDGFEFGVEEEDAE